MENFSFNEKYRFGIKRVVYAAQVFTLFPITTIHYIYQHFTTQPAFLGKNLNPESWRFKVFPNSKVTSRY